jgi:hypothetical protein
MGFLFNTFLTNEYIQRYNNEQAINYVKTINVGINQSSSESNKIELKIHQNSKLAHIMQNLSKIELSVVPKKVCVKNN